MKHEDNMKSIESSVGLFIMPLPEKYDIRALLLALQELYSRMVLRALHHRMSFQRKASATETEHDIAAMLSDHIDELAVSREINIQSMR